MNDCNLNVIGRIASGDDFIFFVTLTEGGTPTTIEAGGDLLVAFYSPTGTPLYHATLSSGAITYDSITGEYLTPVSHIYSETMVGRIKVEVTQIDSNGVEHAPLLYYIDAEPRQNNQLIPTQP